MTRLLEKIENYGSYNLNKAEILMKIKFFLKISKVITEKANIEIKESSKTEKEFFKK